MKTHNNSPVRRRFRVNVVIRFNVVKTVFIIIMITMVWVSFKFVITFVVVLIGITDIAMDGKFIEVIAVGLNSRVKTVVKCGSGM